MQSSRFVQFFRHLNLKTLVQVMRHMGDRRLTGLATEMAYNNLFAMFPSLIGTLAILGTLKVSQQTVSTVVVQFLPLLPQEVVSLLQEFVRQIQIPQSHVVAVVSMLVALWAASGAVSTAMNAMDQIYQTARSERRPFLQAKLISFVLTIASVGLIVLASYLIFISDWLLKLGIRLANLPGDQIFHIWELIRWVLAFAVLALAFSMLYRYGSSRWQPGIPLLPGAMIAAVLWAIVSQGLRIYLSYFGNFNLTYGTLSTGIVLLLWLNLSSLVVLIGAQLNVTVGQAMRDHQFGRYL